MQDKALLRKRAEARTNLFVLAALRSSSTVCPVRIRNLSQRGMLVEGPVLPVTGTVVEIERGSLLASGTIVWSKNGQAGLKLKATVDVNCWLPRQTNSGQQRVDSFFHTVKSGSVTHEGPVERFTGAALDPDALSKELQLVAQSLADDDHVVACHGELLLRLDILVQKVKASARSAPIRT